MMNTAVLTAAPIRTHGVGPLYRASRFALLLLMGIIYAGALSFFLMISPVLLYGMYVVIIGCVAACLFFDWSITRNAGAVLPYLIWMFCYMIWGMLAISHDGGVFKEGVSVLIKNWLLIGALALVLDRDALRPFSNLVQLAVIGNFALCLMESANPDLVAQIAHTRELGATAFNVLRPAGLWSNPDEAASAFVCALLLARWANPILGWIGRIASVVGIYLGASRTGAYLLTICALFHAVRWFRRHRVNSAHLAAAVGIVMLAGASVAVIFHYIHFDPSQHWQLARFLDLAEDTRGRGDVSRLDILREAVRIAVNGPWYGSGLFTFQMHNQPGMPFVMDPPAHNIYVAVWGEAGPIIGAGYLIFLGLGMLQSIRVPMRPGESINVLLMWVCYLIIGVTWHNQFTNFFGILYAGLLWHLPSALRIPRPVAADPQDAPQGHEAIPA